jgi:hypothetical protein
MCCSRKKLLAHPDPAEAEQLPTRLDQSNSATRNLTQSNMEVGIDQTCERQFGSFEPTARNGKLDLWDLSPQR